MEQAIGRRSGDGETEMTAKEAEVTRHEIWSEEIRVSGRILAAVGRIQGWRTGEYTSHISASMP